MMEEELETPVGNSENRKVRKSVLDYFNRISSENESMRLKFGLLLLKHIHTNETQDKENAELKYAVIRLIRGLGASKTSSKIGYYTTLVGLLQTCTSITVDDVLQCVKKQLQTGDSKSELADVYTGQILASGALLHSGLFNNATPEEQSAILQQIVSAGKQRSYLALASSGFLGDLLLKIDDVQFQNVVWPVLRVEVLKSWNEQTIDSLYLLTLVLNRFQHVVKDNTLKKHFGAAGVYSDENVKMICDILMNISGLSFLKHPGYVIISQEISKSNILVSFMTQLNSQLVKPNRNRILATALIIKSVIKSPEALAQLPDLLPNNFIRQVISQYNHNAQNDNYDKDFLDGMTNFFDALFESCKENVDDKSKVAVIKKLLFEPGTLWFEKITKTKILQQLVSSLNEEGVKKLSKVYRGIIAANTGRVVNETVTKPWLNSERIYASQLLVKLLNLPCVQNSMEWKKKQLKFLIDVSIIKHPKYTNVGADLSAALTDIYYRAMDLKFSKLEDMRNLLFYLVNHVASLITPENVSETVRISLTPDDLEIWEKTIAMVNKLTEKTKKYVVVFHVLFLHMGLQLFKEKELAISSLKELFLCYARVKSERKVEKHEDEPEWIEVVIDLFLNLLSHNSHLLRNVVRRVFPHLCRYMTTSSLHQILSVLDPKNETNPLSKHESSDEDDDDVDENDNDDEKTQNAELSESESEEEEDEDEIDDDTGEKETLNDKLRMAVSRALGNDGYKTDEESIDLDDMSDTEGEKLNEALAEAFKQFKPNRGRKNKKQTKDEETLTHFRIRVLDLLESFIASEPAMLSCFEIMLPILQTLEFTVRDPHQAPLQARLKHCLKKLINSRKFSSTDEVTPEIVCDLLTSLLAKGTKSALVFQDMSGEISDCCTFVIKCVQVLSSAETTSSKTKKRLKSGILKIVTDALGVFFNNRDCLIPYPLFKSIFQLNWDGNFVLAPVVYNYVFDESTRPFRRSQALELLKIFYSNNRLRHNPEVFKEHVREHEVQLSDKIVELLDQFCANPNTIVIKERFIYHVFSLLRVMLVKEIRNDKIDWSSIGEKIREYRSHVTLSKDAKLAYNQLCSKLGISKVVKMKNQIVKFTPDDDENPDDDDKAKEKIKQPRKRKLSSSESKRLKKETRDLRLQSLSEGFSGGVSFSSTSLLSMKDIEPEGNNDRKLHNQNETTLKSVVVNGTSPVVKKRLNSETENGGEQIKKKKKHKNSL